MWGLEKRISQIKKHNYNLYSNPKKDNEKLIKKTSYFYKYSIFILKITPDFIIALNDF